MRKGAATLRILAGSPRPVETGGGAVIFFVFALIGFPSGVWQWKWPIVHVDDAISNGRPARSGCIPGRAGGRVPSALS